MAGRVAAHCADERVHRKNDQIKFFSVGPEISPMTSRDLKAQAPGAQIERGARGKIRGRVGAAIGVNERGSHDLTSGGDHQERRVGVTR
jgi:hypothetical protein